METTLTREWVDWMRTGQRLHGESRIVQAIAAFGAAVGIRPDAPEGWVNLSVCLNVAGRSDEALTAVDRALAIDPAMALAHLARGRALASMRRFDEARRALQAGLLLQSQPEILNDLASLMRQGRRFGEACQLYEEAIELANHVTLYHVNLATCLMELQKYPEARRCLHHLKKGNLSPAERDEVETSLVSLEEYERFKEAIDEAMVSGRLEKIEEKVMETPPSRLACDESVVERLSRYAESARSMADSTVIAIDSTHHPEWPLIEALFMVPAIETREEFEAAIRNIGSLHAKSQAWLESMNMVDVIRSMRACPDYHADSIRMECQLRYWHALACRGLVDFLPGHFKMLRNFVATSPDVVRARPDRVVGTLRLLFGEMRNSVPPGMPRALLVFLGLLDIHPFYDGNGRLAMALMNRELETCGLMPALFNAQNGLRGRMAQAMRQSRKVGGDLSALHEVVVNGQEFAAAFCKEVRHISGGMTHG